MNRSPSAGGFHADPALHSTEARRAERPPGDLATLVACFAAELRAAGLPAGPERAERLARAVMVVRPATTQELYWCGRVTLVTDPSQVPAYDRVFTAVFGGLADPAERRGDPTTPPRRGSLADASATPSWARRPAPVSHTAGALSTSSASPDRPATQVPFPARASASERLAARDFAELSAQELALLADLMRQLTFVMPPRRTRRLRAARRGRVDLRATLRQASHTGGHPLRLRRRIPRRRPRRLVVLCDISGSMEPYARAMLQLVYCAAGCSRAEVFTFATRLTRLTRALARSQPQVALERAGRVAPDWSGGTRIAAALREFTDRYGARGMARGAVVLIISDGWETGDPAALGREMARLSRLAHRIVWANPRTQSPRYRPLVGGMAAAWPYCDAVVSAHRLTALDELLAALAAPARRGRAPQPAREHSSR